MKQEFTAQTRKEIKKACKGRVMNNLGRCIGINFLYAVPFVLLFLMRQSTDMLKALAYCFLVSMIAETSLSVSFGKTVIDLLIHQSYPIL